MEGLTPVGPTKRHVVLLMHMNEGSGSLVQDSSSYNHHGTLHGGQWIDQGRFGSAVQFIDQDAVCTVPLSETLDLEQGAIEVWLLGHTHVVSSPHDIGEIVDPFKVRVSLVRGTETDVSPEVDSIRATVFYRTYLPIVVKSVYDN